MDPDKALEKLRRLARAMREADTADSEFVDNASQIAEHFIALDEWIANSGFLPSEWRKA